MDDQSTATLEPEAAPDFHDADAEPTTATVAEPEIHHEDPFKAGLRECLAEVNDAKERMDATKEAAKEAKTEWEAACTRMTAYIEENINQPNGEAPMPLFKDAPAGDNLDDAWRDVPIRDALQGLPDRLYGLLEGTFITSMGEYSDYCNKNAPKVMSGNHPLTLINGIGPAKIEAIQAAEDAFWKRVKLERPAPEATDSPLKIMDESVNGSEVSGPYKEGL